VAALADRDPHRLAPGEVEDLGCDQIVIKDDGRGLQRARRLHRQQFGIAWPGADQGDAAAAALRRTGDQRVEIRFLRRPLGAGPGTADERRPEGAAVGEALEPGLDPRPPALRRFRPGRKAARQHRLDARPDRLAEHRRRAVGRDRQHQHARLTMVPNWTSQSAVRSIS
jgi:hypothetical protein